MFSFFLVAPLDESMLGSGLFGVFGGLGGRHFFFDCVDAFGKLVVATGLNDGSKGAFG